MRDEDSVRRWLRQFEGHILRSDFGPARHLFEDDAIGFGTFTDVARGLDRLERDQWRRTWPHIDRFRFDLDDAAIMPSPDRLVAVVAVTWRSVGAGLDDVPFPRPGRATIVLRRPDVEERWRAVHTHFSLNRGTPQTAAHVVPPSGVSSGGPAEE